MSLSVSFNQTTIITEEDDFTDLESTAEKSELVLGRRSVRSIAAFEEADEVHMDNPLQRPRALTFSPWQPSDSPAVLTWKDLTVSTKTTPPKVLLNNVTGSITGGFWAIMGASGGGKTTLLSTLSLRLDSAKMNIVGDMRFNGRIYQKNALKSMSAYVLQDDLLHAELTVGETISYAAQLRLANICDEEERMFREKEVLDLMGINHVRDVIIGDTRKKGISGGERKRVCVAIELLTRPRLVFLDEPTSGLDSSTALNVITALKKLTDTDICTVVCTIHQPQKRIFDLFDNLLLMKQGTIVYQGSCQKSISFLESIGSPCPPGVNPADFLIEVISPTGNPAFDDHGKKEVPVDLGLGGDKEFSINEFSLSRWWEQFKVLTRRCLQQYIRRTDIILLNLVGTVLLAVFVSCGIWQNIGTTQTSVATRIPSLFFACVTQGILASLQCISSFPSERAIVMRERAAGAYYVSSYFLAKTITDVLCQIWGPTIFCAIVYPTIGYQAGASKFFIYWIFMILDTMAALSLATMVTCICQTIELSTVVLSVLLEMSRLYGGFFTSPLQLNDYPNWRFADALSYLKYTFVGVSINELTGLKLSCTGAQITAKSCTATGEVIMQQRGYDQYTIDFCAGILVVYIVGCRLVAFIALKYSH